MRRLLFFLVPGFALLLLPAWWLVVSLVPVPQFRSGTASDYRPLLIAGLTLYGGALAGLISGRMHTGRALTSSGVFIWCLSGALAAVVVALAIGGGGNLWGLVVILGACLGAMIAGGAALVWRGAAPQHPADRE
jgi:hypothetical protein